MPDRRISDWASLAGWARLARAKWGLRAALAVSSAAVSATALTGVAVTAQPAGAATMRPATTAATSCYPRTDIKESRTNSGAGAWNGHWCGLGYRHPWHSGNTWEHIDVVWGATRPYHRVWFHIYKSTAAWCAWGSTHKVVPLRFRVPGNILISKNTAPCPR